MVHIFCSWHKVRQGFRLAWGVWGNQNCQWWNKGSVLLLYTCVYAAVNTIGRSWCVLWNMKRFKDNRQTGCVLLTTVGEIISSHHQRHMVGGYGRACFLWAPEKVVCLMAFSDTYPMTVWMSLDVGSPISSLSLKWNRLSKSRWITTCGVSPCVTFNISVHYDIGQQPGWFIILLPVAFFIA